MALLAFQALGDGQVRSHAAICLSNLRRLGQAWLMYAEDHGGKLVGNPGDPGTMSLASSNQAWVLGWIDFQGGTSFPPEYGGRANTNTFILSQLSPLAPFAGRDATLFRCPADRSLSFGNRGVPRVRSISMNGYQNGWAWDPGHQVFTRLSDFVSLPPAESFVLIEENESSINDGFFIVSMSGYPKSPQSARMVDIPGAFHNGGVGLNFADGHAELKKWIDARTMPRFNPTGLPALNVPQPNNRDILWLQERTTRREVIQ